MAVIHITKDNYEQQVQNSSVPVLLDFWASWCGPCKMIAPILEEIGAENQDITIGKVNIDEEMELAVKFGIVSIPTLILMSGGKIISKSVGYQPKEDILKLLNEL